MNFAASHPAGYAVDDSTQALHRFGRDGRITVSGKVPFADACYVALVGTRLYVVALSDGRMAVSSSFDPLEWVAQGKVGFPVHRCDGTSLGLLIYGNPRGSQEFLFLPSGNNPGLRGISPFPPVIGAKKVAFAGSSGLVSMVGSSLSIEATSIAGRPIGFVGDNLLVLKNNSAILYGVKGAVICRLPGFPKVNTGPNWGVANGSIWWLSPDGARVNVRARNGEMVNAPLKGAGPKYLLCAGGRVILLDQGSRSKTAALEARLTGHRVTFVSIGAVDYSVNARASGVVGDVLFLAAPFRESKALHLSLGGPAPWKVDP